MTRPLPTLDGRLVCLGSVPNALSTPPLLISTYVGMRLTLLETWRVLRTCSRSCEFLVIEILLFGWIRQFGRPMYPLPITTDPREISRWVRVWAMVKFTWHMMPLRCDLRTCSRPLLAPFPRPVVWSQMTWNRCLSRLQTCPIPRPLCSRMVQLDRCVCPEVLRRLGPRLSPYPELSVWVGSPNRRLVFL